MFRIYYEDGSVVEGSNKGAWSRAPASGVQAIAQFPRQVQPVRWFYLDPDTGRPVIVRDRDLWTGDDVYDPFGYGVKLGSLIPDVQYFDIWRRACADP